MPYALVFHQRVQAADASPRKHMQELTQNLAGSVTTVAVGERFRLVLDENPTTGFRWSLTPCEHVQVESDSFEAGDGKLGAGGRHVWTLHAISAGSCSLNLHSRRSWEATPASTLTFAVTVTP